MFSVKNNSPIPSRCIQKNAWLGDYYIFGVHLDLGCFSRDQSGTAELLNTRMVNFVILSRYSKGKSNGVGSADFLQMASAICNDLGLDPQRSELFVQSSNQVMPAEHRPQQTLQVNDPVSFLPISLPAAACVTQHEQNSTKRNDIQERWSHWPKH